jgi:hypothetical protein
LIDERVVAVWVVDGGADLVSHPVKRCEAVTDVGVTDLIHEAGEAVKSYEMITCRRVEESRGDAKVLSSGPA